MFEAVRGVAAWWLGELVGLIPPPLKRLFAGSSGSFVCEWDNDAATLWRIQGDDATQLAAVSLSGEVAAAPHIPKPKGFSWLRTRRAMISVYVSPEHVLRKRIRLPRAAEPNLKDVVALQIERRTPFGRNDVYFDFRTVSHDGSDGSMLVEFAIVPRNVVDECLSRLRDWSLTASMVSTGRVREGIEPEYSFYHSRKAVPASNAIRATVAALSLTAITLVGVLIYLPIVRLEQRAGQLDALAQQARIEAHETRQLQAEFEALIRDQRQLIARKLDSPTTISLLSELTRLVPDDTWLFQFQLKGDEVQIQGYSVASSKLIEPIESSPLFANPTFRSRVTRDPKSGLERFHLSVALENEAGK